jgi:hypothetical protein
MLNPLRVALDSNQVQLEFLQTELSTGLMFAGLALGSRDQIKTKRNCKNARAAYDALLRFMGRVTFTPIESKEFADGLIVLKSKLQQLGETFS